MRRATFLIFFSSQRHFSSRIFALNATWRVFFLHALIFCSAVAVRARREATGEYIGNLLDAHGQLVAYRFLLRSTDPRIHIYVSVDYQSSILSITITLHFTAAENIQNIINYRNYFLFSKV